MLKVVFTVVADYKIMYVNYKYKIHRVTQTTEYGYIRKISNCRYRRSL
jgi:hypothetical protein